jgi:hypothetical protein
MFSSGELFALTSPSSSTFSLFRFCGSGLPYSNLPFRIFRIVPSLSLAIYFTTLAINWHFLVLSHVCTLGYLAILESFADVFDYLLSDPPPLKDVNI